MPSVLDYATSYIQAVTTGDDAGRLAKRREVRRKIAEGELAKQKYLQLQNRLAELDREAGAAADAHREVAEPTQVELASVEDEIANLVADRQAVATELEAKRRELIERIEVANEQLAEQVSRIDRLRTPLNKAVREAGAEAAKYAAIPNELTSQELADPKLWCEHFALSEVSKAIATVARVAQAKAGEAEQQALLADGQQQKAQAELYRRRIPKWRATIAAAEQVRREVEQRAQTIFKQMQDE